LCASGNEYCSVHCGKDYANDKSKLKTEIYLQSLEGTSDNLPGTGCSPKMEDKMYL